MKKTKPEDSKPWTWKDEYCYQQCQKAEARKKFWADVRGVAAFLGTVIGGTIAFVLAVFLLAALCCWIEEINGLRGKVKDLELRVNTLEIWSPSPERAVVFTNCIDYVIPSVNTTNDFIILK